MAMPVPNVLSISWRSQERHMSMDSLYEYGSCAGFGEFTMSFNAAACP
jgi:hypothetical protein